MSIRDTIKEKRNIWTPQAWLAVWEASKALFELLYSFGYFIVYPFVQGCIAFYNTAIKDFIGKSKEAWVTVSAKAIDFGKKVKSLFAKKSEEPIVPEEPEIVTDTW